MVDIEVNQMGYLFGLILTIGVGREMEAWIASIVEVIYKQTQCQTTIAPLD